MAAIEPALIEKLQKLPPQRLAEVKDFVEFLTRTRGTRRRWRAPGRVARQARRLGPAADLR